MTSLCVIGKFKGHLLKESCFSLRIVCGGEEGCTD